MIENLYQLAINLNYSYAAMYGDNGADTNASKAWETDRRDFFLKGEKYQKNCRKKAKSIAFLPINVL